MTSSSWPLCVSDNIIVHVGEVHTSRLQPGDFCFCVLPTRNRTVHLVVKYRVGDKLQSLSVHEQNFNRVFSRAWPDSVMNTDQSLMASLRQCMVLVEQGTDRLPWEQLCCVQEGCPTHPCNVIHSPISNQPSPESRTGKTEEVKMRGKKGRRRCKGRSYHGSDDRDYRSDRDNTLSNNRGNHQKQTLPLADCTVHFNKCNSSITLGTNSRNWESFVDGDPGGLDCSASQETPSAVEAPSLEEGASASLEVDPIASLCMRNGEEIACMCCSRADLCCSESETPRNNSCATTSKNTPAINTQLPPGSSTGDTSTLPLPCCGSHNVSKNASSASDATSHSKDFRIQSAVSSNTGLFVAFL